MNGIVDNIENHVTEHFTDTSRRVCRCIGCGQDELRGKHEARHNRNNGCGKRAYQIENENGLDVEVLAGQILIGNRAHHEHEHQNRSNRLKGRHKDGAKKAALHGSGRSCIGKRDAKHQTDQNLLD